MSWKIVNTATKWINKKLDFSDLLKSRIVLYFFVFLSIVNLYNLAINRNGLYAAIFILTSFLTTFFSKNMIVVLCVGLVVSNILRQGIEIRVVQEGMSNEDGKESMKEGIAELDESDDTIIKDKSKEDGAKEDESKEDESKEDESKEDGAKEDKSKEDGAKEEPKPADEDVLLNSKLEYKRLLELQNKLIDGVSKMTPILKEAREAFENIKNMNGV